jgi:hypothetical protein
MRDPTQKIPKASKAQVVQLLPSKSKGLEFKLQYYPPPTKKKTAVNFYTMKTNFIFDFTLKFLAIVQKREWARK